MSEALVDQVREAMTQLSIATPDSPIRKRWWWQMYVRLARPTLDWVGVAAGAWALFLCEVFDNRMDDGTRIIVLGFVAGLHGIRTFEAVKGVR